MKSFFFVFLTFLSLASQVRAQDKMPSVIVQTPDGQKIDAASLVKPGKITVFSFWATWCGPCKKELNNIKIVYAEWQKKYNVEVVAVSIDDTRNFSKVKPYIDGQRWTFTSVVDSNSDLKRAMNFQSVPHTVVVDSNGIIVWQHDGYTEGDEFELEEQLKKLAGK